MTKNEDIWFYDSNDFTVVYSPNAFIYIAELNKQAPVVNLNASSMQGALTENPDLKVPLLSRLSYFQCSCEAGQWKKKEEERGEHRERERENASYLHINAMSSYANLALKAFTQSCHAESLLPHTVFLSFGCSLMQNMLFQCTSLSQFLHDMSLDVRQPLRELNSFSLTFCPCGMRALLISLSCLAGLMMAHNN